MSNLFASLNSISNGMGAFQRSLEVSQNNVSNASTPGYARQSVNFQAIEFDSRGGMLGGVRAGSAQSSRDGYAEKTVQRQTATLGELQERSRVLTSLNEILAITGDTSIPGSLNALVGSFSAWSVAPNSATARQGVVLAADQFAATVRATAQQVQSIAVDTARKLDDTTAKINSLGVRLAEINAARNGTTAADPALDTALHNTLDELAEITNFTVLPGENGTVSVLVGGQSPLVSGDRAFTFKSVFATSPSASGGLPTWQMLDSQQRDVSANISTGQVRALSDLYGRALPAIIGGGSGPGELNEFASAVAARINSVLSSGTLSTGLPPGSGLPLFSISVNPTEAAATLTLNDTVTPGQLGEALAAIQSGPPLVSNGIPLTLASLLDANDPANLINGKDALAAFGRIASNVGGALQTANDGVDRSTNLLMQARAMREELSGVSLDGEAARIIELQRGYQAIARVASVIDEMMQSVLGMVG